MRLVESVEEGEDGGAACWGAGGGMPLAQLIARIILLDAGLWLAGRGTSTMGGGDLLQLRFTTRLAAVGEVAVSAAVAAAVVDIVLFGSSALVVVVTGVTRVAAGSGGAETVEELRPPMLTIRGLSLPPATSSLLSSSGHSAMVAGVGCRCGCMCVKEWR